MEIDGDKINLSDNSESPRIFQITYAGERLNNNPKFQKWKTEMFKIYGDDAEFFKCLIDNIIFSTPFDEYKIFHFIYAIVQYVKLQLVIFSLNIVKIHIVMGIAALKEELDVCFSKMELNLLSLMRIQDDMIFLVL